jgi:hypothetical protein
MTQNEIEALDAFRKALEEARKEYKLQGDELRDALNLPPGTPGYYAAALVVQSESSSSLSLEMLKGYISKYT